MVAVMAALMLVALWVLAVDPGDPSTWLAHLDKIGAFGLLGMMVTAFWKGWIVSKPTYDAVVKERDALRASSDALLKSYQAREEEERRWQQARWLAGRPEEGTAK